MDFDGSNRKSSALLEDDGFVAVEQDAVLDVPADGSREDYLFDVAAFFNQILDGVAVRDAFDTLFDDGAVVEDFGDVVGGGADDFYATVEGLLVGLGSDECGQERMMNIDDLLRELFDKAGGKHLHITG